MTTIEQMLLEMAAEAARWKEISWDATYRDPSLSPQMVVLPERVVRDVAATVAYWKMRHTKE